MARNHRKHIHSRSDLEFPEEFQQILIEAAMDYRYTVKATFTSHEVAQEWVHWLKEGHCQDVRRCGASSVEVVALDTEQQAFEVRYVFPNHQAFQAYEAEHAHRLRQEGLALFPTDRGITYARSTGAVIFTN